MKTITYDVRQGEQKIRYEVSFDEEQVSLFCHSLMKEAYHTVHFDYTAVHGPFGIKLPGGISVDDNSPSFPMKTVSNYKKTPTTERDTDSKILVPMYHFEYDENYYPYLLVLLGNVLTGNALAVQEIMYPTFEKEYIPIRAEIANREDQYRNIDTKNGKDIVERKLKVIEELFLHIKNYFLK